MIKTTKLAGWSIYQSSLVFNNFLYVFGLSYIQDHTRSLIGSLFD